MKRRRRNAERRSFLALWDAQHGCKLPRKVKKAALGRRRSIKTIKRMILDYKSAQEETSTFCPFCGCESTRIMNHDVGYPEIWIEVFCLRCGSKVEEADNSDFIHILDSRSMSELMILPMQFHNRR